MDGQRVEEIEYRNSFRFAGAPRWFDFYNCRVALPEQGFFFYTMPFSLSGAETGRGFWVYDGGNGGPSGGSRCAVERLDPGDMRASSERCDVRWSKPGADDNLFSARRIRLAGPSCRWDITIEPFLADEQVVETDRRRYDVTERLLLQRAPFIHRVPRMKGFAAGTIEQEGRLHRFERGIVYQAKNHGRAFPERWLWIHANAFPEAPGLAVEAASLLAHDGKPMTLARVATPERVVMLSSLTGDDVEVGFDGGRYAFRAAAKDGSFAFSGEGRHGDEVVFSFPAPEGGVFESHECFVEPLAVRLEGRSLTAGLAALAHARWLPPAHSPSTPGPSA